MSEQEQREVGPAMWGGRRLTSVNHLPTRRSKTTPPEATARTIDVRDALALALLVAGVIVGLVAVEQLAGWWAIAAVLSAAAVVGGVALGWRE